MVDTLLGQTTETVCKLGVADRYQKGKGNTDEANLPQVLPPFFLGSNGNVLPVDNVILPQLKTVGKYRMVPL